MLIKKLKTMKHRCIWEQIQVTKKNDLPFREKGDAAIEKVYPENATRNVKGHVANEEFLENAAKG